MLTEWNLTPEGDCASCGTPLPGRFEGAPETWIAPTFGTQPGIFMYRSPHVGQRYSQGYAPHIRFYDRARVLRKGLKLCVPG